MQTYLDTQQNLSLLLETAAREGAVRIRRADGQEFVLRPEEGEVSPLDIEGIDLNLTAHDILDAVREGRRVV